ncbi:hypothetical protein FJZ18_02750 [Candidatus Pacearchaeota archaeon]|nr:hypothetical protein [Candidatus Pacearchaeota archaeon]
MNKKGQTEISKTMTFFPVFILLFVILLLFFALTFAISAVKRVQTPFLMASAEKGNSILFETITVDGKKVLFIEGLFIYHGKKTGLVSDPSFEWNFLHAAQAMFEKNAKKDITGIKGYSKICLMAGIDEGKKSRGLAFVMHEDGRVVTGDNQRGDILMSKAVVYDFPSKRLESISLIVDGERKILSYYYGKCYRSAE